MRACHYLYSQTVIENEAGGNGAAGRKVKDSRRHTFTPAGCSEGFRAGLASYVERGGEPRNFLRRKVGARGQVFTATRRRDRGRVAA